MNNYSPNMLKTFDECEKKFYFKYVKKLSLPQRSTIFAKGKKIHALANYYLSGQNIEKLESVLNPNEKSAWEILKSNKYFKLKALNTEFNLSCKVQNNNKCWIGGRLDAFMQDMEAGKETPNYFILDYKTGNIPNNPEEDFQTIVYLLCADKFLKENYNSLKFVYIGIKNNTEKEIILTPNSKKIYEDKITNICKRIDFANNSAVFVKNKNCQNCEFYKFCSM